MCGRGRHDTWLSKPAPFHPESASAAGPEHSAESRTTPAEVGILYFSFVYLMGKLTVAANRAEIMAGVLARRPRHQAVAPAEGIVPQPVEAVVWAALHVRVCAS